MKIDCKRCGVERTISVIGKVSIGSTTLSFRRMCLPCFLKANGLLSFGNEFNVQGAYETLDEAEKRWKEEEEAEQKRIGEAMIGMMSDLQPKIKRSLGKLLLLILIPFGMVLGLVIGIIEMIVEKGR